MVLSHKTSFIFQALVVLLGLIGPGELATAKANEKKVYILAGDLDGANVESLYPAIDLGTKFRRDGYTPILNLSATEESLGLALRDERAWAVVWIGHSRSHGGITDSNGELISTETFVTPQGGHFPLFIPIACWAKKCVVEHYNLHGKPVKYLGGGKTKLNPRVALESLANQYSQLKKYVEQYRCQALLNPQ